jgi:hypothetical protein
MYSYKVDFSLIRQIFREELSHLDVACMHASIKRTRNLEEVKI